MTQKTHDSRFEDFPSDAPDLADDLRTAPPGLADVLAELAGASAASDASDASDAAQDEVQDEVLLDYLDGTLPGAEKEALQRRLVADRALSRRLLDLSELMAAEASVGVGPADLAARAGWRDFQARLSGAPKADSTAESAPAAGADVVPFGRPRTQAETSGAAHRLRTFQRLAAVLALAVLGLGAYVVQLRSATGGSTALGEVTSHELITGVRSGGDAELDIVELAPGAALRLVLDPVERCDAYGVTLARPGSSTALTRSAVRPDSRGLVEVLFAGAGPGVYELVLSGCAGPGDDAQPAALETHRFEVRRAPAEGDAG